MPVTHSEHTLRRRLFGFPHGNCAVLQDSVVPDILIAVIEVGIFINLGLPHYLGQSMAFITPICISTIQLGATVDYAILMTTRYKAERIAGRDKKNAVWTALYTSIPSIIVSGMGLFAATFGVALYSDIEIISSMCMLMAMKLELIAKHEKDSRACRDAFALTLKDMMAADKSVCYVDCDLMGCVNTKQLMAAYPDRAYEAGIAEANAAGVCAGLAATGKKVYLHTFGTFASRRIYDQIYMSAAYADLPVHVFGSDAGVCAAFNGGTHMPLEDAAMYLSIPKAVVTDPCDYAQLKAVTEQVADCDCVTYTRFVRKDIIRVYGDDTEFTLGKGVVLHESSHDAATIITSGIMVDEALKAYEALDAEGIAVRVVDMFTWKPLDEELVLRCAAETGAIVTAENHNVVCGLGSAVANCLAKNHPTVQEFVGVQDMFGQVGPQSFLMDEYGLRAANIVAAVKKAIGRK